MHVRTQFIKPLDNWINTCKDLVSHNDCVVVKLCVIKLLYTPKSIKCISLGVHLIVSTKVGVSGFSSNRRIRSLENKKGNLTLKIIAYTSMEINYEQTIFDSRSSTDEENMRFQPEFFIAGHIFTDFLIASHVTKYPNANLLQKPYQIKSTMHYTLS